MGTEGSAFGGSSREERPGSAPAPPAGEAQTEDVLPGGVADIVSEIRAELADISAHELELHRREQSFAQEYRRLERAARQAAWAEVEQQRQDLARQTVTLQGRVAKLHEREAALDARARELAVAREALIRAQQAFKHRQGDLSGRLERIAARFRARRATLRQRIDLIRHREEDLQRRIRLARDEIVREREVLHARLADADARLAALQEADQAIEARRREVEQAEEALAQRKQQVEEALRLRRQELEQAIAGRRRDAEQAVEARHREAQQAIEARRREVAQALDARRREVAALEARNEKARSELETQRQALVDERNRLLAERDALRQSRETLGSQDAGLAERQAALEAAEVALAERSARLERESRLLEDQRGALEARLREVEARAASLDERERALADKGRALDQDYKERSAALERAHRERTAALDRAQSDRARALEKSHKERGAALEREHAQRLSELARSKAEQEAQVEQARRDLETRALAAEERQAELDRRQAAVEESRRRASSLEQQARASLDRAHALREEIELRDNESRQAAMAIEVERQEIARDRGILGQLQAEFDTQRAAYEDELALARTKLRGWAERLQEAQRRWGALPARWWLRSAALSALLGVIAALAWLGWQPPVYQARVDFAITAAAPETLPAVVDPNLPVGGLATTPGVEQSWRARVAGEHARALLDPALLAASDAGMLAQVWSGALRGDLRAAGGVRVWAESATMPLEVRLVISGSPRERVERMARLAADQYTQRVGTQAVGAGLPDDFFALERWRSELMARQRESEAALSEATTTRSRLPSPADRAAAVERAAAAQRELAEVSRSLDAERAALAVLVATDSPATAVDPGELQKALDEDPLYGEDLRELRDAGTKFRAELQAALLMLAEPVDVLGRTLTKSAAAVSEQIALDPPASLRETLGAWQAALVAADERQDAFAVAYRRHVKDIDGFVLRDDALESGVLELVRAQNSIVESVGDFAGQTGALVEALTRHTTAASQHSGSTREIVVATALRAELSALKSAAEAVAVAAGRCTTRDNVELDAADRQLRGLRTRLRERRELVDGRLRIEAQRAARETLDAQIGTARKSVRDLDTRREQLVSASLAALDEVRRLDEAARTWDALTARIEAAQRDIGQSSDAIRELDERLAEIRRRSAEPDRVTTGPVRVDAIETGRGANALVAALGAAATVWLVALAMVARPPWRREEPLDIEALLAGPGTTGVDSAT